MDINPPTVALIDDDPAVRTALARLFRTAGIALRTFASAEEFIQAKVLPSTACVIVDVHMPGMSGPQFQQFCRRHRCNLPVIMITAFSDDDAENRSMAAGAKAFFRKPFDGASLLNTVRLSLPQSGQQ